MTGATLEFSDPAARSASGLRRLVIVADNSLLVEAIRIGFRKSGEFNLVGHADGHRTSAETILSAEPDVVLLDDMDQSEQALALLRAIREAEKPVCVIILSMQLDPAWLERAFVAGATGVISKATHPAALATLVRETVSGHIFHRQPAPPANLAGAAARVRGGDLPLTDRELEILQLVASGCTNGDVARQLWVTEQTVKFHLRNVYRKLDVANRTQASHFAHVQGLVSPVATAATAAAPELTVAS